MAKKLIDQAALDTYHDPDREIVACALYPELPIDMVEWANVVITDEVAREKFLRLLGTEYYVQLMVDKNTGDFDVALVEFNEVFG